MKKLLVLIFVLSFYLSNAQFVVDGIAYNITSATEPYTVEVIASDPKYTGDVVIPETVEDNLIVYTVTGIGSSAFENCYNLNSISIPSTIIIIGSNAFSHCGSLTSMFIPASVKSIEIEAFFGCTNINSFQVDNDNLFYASIDGVLYNKGITSLIQCPIPKTSITIPNTVTLIEMEAFANCSGLTSVSVPNSVISIGVAAFAYCYGLTSLSIPSSVTSIGSSAFHKCTGLISISLPNTITAIESYTFNLCSSLTSLSIPSSVTSIEVNAFDGCSKLTDINVAEDNTVFTSIDGVIYNKDVSSLIVFPAGKSSLVIPNTVNNIGYRACYWCQNLTSVVIPNSVTTIGERAFSNCTALKSLSIPSAVTNIGDNAFEHCDGMNKMVATPMSPPILSNSVFSYVPKTIPLYVPEESVDAYKSADQWKDFNILPIATVTDIDGNVYNTVTIGDQVWMAENLKTTKYNNGDEIGTTTPATLDISGEIEPKYQWTVTDDENSVDLFGRFYTWYAATDERNVCPAGWHVPSDDEWTALKDYLEVNGYGYEGSGSDIAKSMAVTSGWDESINAGAIGNDQASNNNSGFTGIPAGARHSTGVNNLFGKSAYFWGSTENSINPSVVADTRFLSHSASIIQESVFANKNDGYSIRCLKDTEATPSLTLIVQDVTADEDQGLEVPISVSELVADDNIIAYQFDIDYDNTTVQHTGSNLTGTLAEGGTVTVNSSVDGTLNISYMTSTALVGAGDILLLQFNTLKADTTEVLISNAYLNATEVTDLTAGTVIIKDATPPTAAITYDDSQNRCGDVLLITATFDEPMLGTNAVKITMTGATTLAEADMTRVSETVYTYTYTIPKADGQVTINLSNGTDLWANEVVSTPTSGETFSIISVNYGDVDDDGKILAYDAALTLQYSVGLDPLPTIDPLPWENWRDTTANVDGVSGITANDAGMILQYSAGIITSFDASAKKSVYQGFISIEVINNEIILYSYGDLLGLNISAVNEDHILETPIIMADNLLSAFYIKETTYSVGICAANSPENGVAVMKIPYTKSGAVTLNMIVNTDVDTRTLNLSYSELTGMDELNAGNITIYPNPASDLLSVQGLENKTTGRIYNSSGQLMFSSVVDVLNGEIIVSALPSGLYILKMNVDDGVVMKRFIKE
jgi:uncharacterized protein (TIGR02145 family)